MPHNKPLYTALKGPAHIRLLRIDPHDHGDGMIHCRFRQRSLDDKPSFAALSYTWGDAQSTDPHIICNGLKVTVRQKLHDFLVQSRHSFNTDLWIDALCINQGDVPEKNHQLKNMGRIYKQASFVLAWLGTASEHVSEAFHLLAKFADRNKAGAAQKIRRAPDWRCLLGGLESVKDEVLSACMQLGGRPYFRRTWIVQELALAQKVVVVCGSFQIPWEYFQDGLMNFSAWTMEARNLRTNLVEQMQQFSTATTPHDLIHIRRRYQSRETKPLNKRSNRQLFDYLMLTREQCATNPRDKIFALLGLANDGSFVVPNYDDTVEKVFTDVAVHYLVDQRFFEFIRGAGNISSAEYNSRYVDAASTVARLPSRVPDWRLSPRAAPLHAKGFAADLEPVSCRRSVKRFLLNLDVKLFDELALVGPSTANTNSRLLDFFMLASNLQQHPYREPMRDVITSALLCGSDSDLDVISHEESTLLYMKWLQDRESNDRLELPESVHPNTQNRLSTFTDGRRHCLTDRGYVGWAPIGAEEGDIVALIPGVRPPCILRRLQQSIGYHFIGECYIHGIMNGEAMVHNREMESIDLY